MSVAGIEVELMVPRGPLELIVAERYGPFLGAVTEPVCSLEFAGTGLTEGAPNPPLAELDGATGHTVEVSHPDFTATFALEGEGRLTVAENQYTIDHAFRLLFGLLAPRHDAVMLHSCGVITGGVANVFAGESGAGKSTLASFAGHRPLLSDEHVMVRRIRGEWLACSTPFWGSYARPGPARQAPLDRLWSLVQWPTNEIRVVDQEAGLRTALDNAVLPCAEPALKSAVFEVAIDLVTDIRCAELRFAPVPEIWEEIDACVALA